MAGLTSVRASPRGSLPVRRSSAAEPPPASQVAVRFKSPLFRSAKVCKKRGLVAAALEASKDGSSAVLAKCLPSKDAIAMLRDADAICFDVDSTVILDEGIDELADFCGAGKAVAEWTAKAMTGTVPFEEALAARLSLIKPSLSQVEECLEKRPPRYAPIILMYDGLLLEKLRGPKALLNNVGRWFLPPPPRMLTVYAAITLRRYVERTPPRAFQQPMVHHNVVGLRGDDTVGIVDKAFETLRSTVVLWTLRKLCAPALYHTRVEKEEEHSHTLHEAPQCTGSLPTGPCIS
ncbi:unnamed protein product [Urochloa humidicola]